MLTAGVFARQVCLSNVNNTCVRESQALIIATPCNWETPRALVQTG